MRYANLLLAVPLLLATSPAPAQASAKSWNDWVYRANSILRAAEAGEQAQVNTVCRNIVMEMTSIGLPKWSRELIGTCDALKEGFATGRRGKFCSKAKENARAFRKAAPVEEEPRAYPIGIKVAVMMETLYDGLCR